MKRWILAAAAVVVVLYAGACAWVFWLMHRPPEQFAKSFGRLPMAALVALPFEPMWLNARAGSVKVGDTAPDFDLPTLDKKSRVSLSSLRGKPVLLVFGSYT